MVTNEFTLVYILGAGHCGSTLLNLLLNGHSQVLGLSEIETIGRYTASGGDVQDNPLHTAFWQGVKRCYEHASGEPFAQIDIFHPPWKTIRGWRAEDISRWAQTNAYLLSCIAKKPGVSVLIDASKFWQRLHLLQQSEMFNIKVIHLVRDGRAVINSYIRKGKDFNAALRRWATPALCAFYLRRKFRKHSWLQVQYGELVTRPEATLQVICTFLQVNFEPDMLAYRQHPDVGIGGNRMRKRSDERILLDDRWKRELSRLDRTRFAFLGGWLNKYYGY